MTKNNQTIVYQGENGEIILKKDSENETIWANQKEIAEIFKVNVPAINKHIKNIFKEKELNASTISILETVQKEGNRKVKRKVEYYNLDMLISVGYRINSVKGTKFRKWSTKTLKEHIVQGFTINPKRIEKNHQAFLQVVEDIKLLAQNNQNLQTNDVLELIKNVFKDEEVDKKNNMQKMHIAKQGIKKYLFRPTKENVYCHAG